jgi:hypothetical protein
VADKCKIVSLAQYKEENTPHLSGPARCLACNHEWVAVAPVGTDFMECPACRTMKGVFYSPVLYGSDVWVCHCGSDLFRIHPEKGIYCPVCGQLQEGY